MVFKMPEKLGEIHPAVKKKLDKKTKSFSVFAVLSKHYEEESVVQKSGKTIEKGKNRFVEVIISGLETDRQNERMSQEAITDMIDQLKSGTVPFFFDHGVDSFGNQTYPWKGIGGVWVDGKQEGDHLKAVVRLNRAHPDHEQFWGYLQEDMPVGFSVAGMSVEEPTFEEPQ